MNEETYQDFIKAVKFQIHQARKDTIAKLEKEQHPEFLDANAEYSKLSAELARNYNMAIKAGGGGDISTHNYERQLKILQDNRDERHIKVFRKELVEAKNESLQEMFGDDKSSLERAHKEIDNDPKLQWLKEPEDRIEPNKEQDEKSASDGSEEKSGETIPAPKAEFNQKGVPDGNQKINLPKENTPKQEPEAKATSVDPPEQPKKKPPIEKADPDKEEEKKSIPKVEEQPNKASKPKIVEEQNTPKLEKEETVIHQEMDTVPKQQSTVKIEENTLTVTPEEHDYSQYASENTYDKYLDAQYHEVNTAFAKYSSPDTPTPSSPDPPSKNNDGPEIT